MAAASRCERSVVLENTAELADWVAADPARKDMAFAGYRTDNLYSFDMGRVCKIFKKTVYKRRNL